MSREDRIVKRVFRTGTISSTGSGRCYFEEAHRQNPFLSFIRRILFDRERWLRLQTYACNVDDVGTFFYLPALRICTLRADIARHDQRSSSRGGQLLPRHVIAGSIKLRKRIIRISVHEVIRNNQIPDTQSPAWILRQTSNSFFLQQTRIATLVFPALHFFFYKLEVIHGYI